MHFKLANQLLASGDPMAVSVYDANSGGACAVPFVHFHFERDRYQRCQGFGGACSHLVIPLLGWVPTVWPLAASACNDDSTSSDAEQQPVDIQGVQTDNHPEVAATLAMCLRRRVGEGRDDGAARLCAADAAGL